MNTQRTDGHNVTVALPVCYELVGKDGRLRAGTYPTMRDAYLAAKCLWPDQEQDEARITGWDIEIVYPDQR